MIDRRPALVGALPRRGRRDRTRSSSRATRSCSLAVRGGGHNIAGNAVCDGGLLIDLSLMKSVRVDPKTRTARVEPGATLADFDNEAQAFGARDAARHQFDDRRRRPHARRRLRLDHAQIRPDHRQSHLGRRRHGRRQAGPRQRERATRICSGRCAAAAAISASSPRSSSSSIRSGPRCCRASSCIRSTRRTSCCREFRRIANEAPDELTVWAVMRKAPPLPFLPAGVARQGGPHLRGLLQRRHGGGREGDARAARARQADRRRHRAAPVHRLAGGVRSAADARRAQLLEEPRLRRSLGRGDRA